MKSPLFLPIYLFLVLLACLVALTAVSMLWAWLEWAPYGERAAFLVVFAHVAASAEACLPAALLPALLLTGLRVARIPVSRPFSLLLPPLTAFCLLYLGPMGLRALGAIRADEPSVALTAHLRSGVLVEAAAPGGAAVVLRPGQVAGREGSEVVDLRDLVVKADGARPPRLQYFAEAEAKRDAADIGVHVGGNTYRVPLDPPWRELAEPSVGTLSLISDLEVLNRELDGPGTELASVLAATGVVTFFWFSCFVLRLTKWPLLSIVLLGLLWRGALVGIRFLGDVVRPGLVRLLEGAAAWQQAAYQTVSLALLLAAVLALGFDLIFVRFDYWKREIEV